MERPEVNSLDGLFLNEGLFARKQQRADGTAFRELYETHTMLMMKMGDFRCSEIPDRFYEALRDDTVLNLKEFANFEGINEKNYVKTLGALLHCEFARLSVDLRKFDKRNVELTVVGPARNSLLRCYDSLVRVSYRLPGVSDKNPALVPGDYVVLEDSSGSSRACQINSTLGDELVISTRGGNQDRDYFEGKFNLSFVSSGIPTDACFKALKCYAYDSEFLRGAIFDISSEPSAARESHEPTGLRGERVKSGLERLNEEQRQSIEAILSSKCRPRPYILFGPPGTGKTSTLLEAVVQIRLRTSCSILFCANSNTCVDEIAKRLKSEDLPDIRYSVVRLGVGDNFRNMDTSKGIVVTTNIKAHCLIDRRQFDFVFVDEAAHANEAESLVPICLLKRDGCLILAGDPKQLGAVTKVQELERIGLDTSMLERLFNFEVYRKGPDGKYNPDYITKLLVSYRCDARILAPCNRLFYENELVCPNSTPRGSVLKLLKFDSPRLSLNVEGEEWRPGNSTSWANDLEAKKCAELTMSLYKKGFEAHQIGIITPYRLQARRIRDQLKQIIKSQRDELDERFGILELVEEEEEKKRNESDIATGLANLKIGDSSLENKKPKYRYKNIDWLCKIDTVDSFQGSEMDVIIISTVRTGSNLGAQPKSLGFINDKRRFNVAISRAKWLVITIGDRDALENLECWREYFKV